MPETPERRARREIDADLTAAGWRVQDRDDIDLTADRGIAVREFPMNPGFGFAELRKGEDVYAAIGKTRAGRALMVFFIYKRRERDALVVSARTPSKRERNL